MTRYPFLLLDADNTLFDFDRNEDRAFSMLCAKYRLPCSPESRAVYESFNQPLWEQLEQGLVTKDFLKVERFRRFLAYYHRSEDAAAVGRDFLAFLGTGSLLMPHAEEACRALARRHRLYILTNSVASVHIDRMHQAAIAPYIEASFISETVGYEKPHPAVFETVLASIPGITRDNCLLIGDSLTSDIRGGIGSGLPVCWYNPARQAAPPELAIDYTITDLMELPALVD